jgi:hypothetical protein
MTHREAGGRVRAVDVVQVDAGAGVLRGPARCSSSRPCSTDRLGPSRQPHKAEQQEYASRQPQRYSRSRDTHSGSPCSRQRSGLSFAHMHVSASRPFTVAASTSRRQRYCAIAGSKCHSRCVTRRVVRLPWAPDSTFQRKSRDGPCTAARLRQPPQPFPGRSRLDPGGAGRARRVERARYQRPGTQRQDPPASLHRAPPDRCPKALGS